jgi:hypothetical protein
MWLGDDDLCGLSYFHNSAGKLCVIQLIRLKLLVRFYIRYFSVILLFDAVPKRLQTIVFFTVVFPIRKQYPIVPPPPVKFKNAKNKRPLEK